LGPSKKAPLQLATLGVLPKRNELIDDMRRRAMPEGRNCLLLLLASTAVVSSFLAACSSHTDIRALGTRAYRTCLSIKASEVQVQLGRPTRRGMSGNAYPVSARIYVGAYIWVDLSAPLTENAYPATTSPVLDRVCTRSSQAGSESLFVAKHTGVATVVSDPRPSRDAMMVFEALITVVPSNAQKSTHP
jgi:hypothetical protein